ncbi:MAG: hypothetical protein ACK5LK_07750 [Chthoniobacterales bacterium]
MPSEWIENDERLNEAFRLAYLLCADREIALGILKTALNKLAHYAEKSNPQRAERFLLFEIRRLCLARKKIENKILLVDKKQSDSPAALLALAPSAVLALLQTLPDPGRSVAALFYATKQTAEEIAHILSLSEKQVFTELDIVRRTLRQKATDSK